MYYIVEVEDRHVESVEAFHSIDVAVNRFKELLEQHQDEELKISKEEILENLDLFIEGTNDDVEIPYISKYGNECTIALTV